MINCSLYYYHNIHTILLAEVAAITLTPATGNKNPEGILEYVIADPPSVCFIITLPPVPIYNA